MRPCYSLAIIQTEVQLLSGGIGNLTFSFAFYLNFELHIKKKLINIWIYYLE